MKFIVFIIFISFFVNNFIDARYGVDLATPTNQSHWDCLANNGFDFAIIRAGRSNGLLDSNAINNINFAKYAGFKEIDAYIFPCVKCGKPDNQVRDVLKYLKNNGVKIGKLWLDIEETQYWTSSIINNRKFFQGLILGARQSGLKTHQIGVYTSSFQWKPIMGPDYNGGAAYQLWYAHYERQPNPSFSDYVPFGGWNHPTIKQYVGDTFVCDVQIDLNFRK